MEALRLLIAMLFGSWQTQESPCGGKGQSMDVETDTGTGSGGGG